MATGRMLRDMRGATRQRYEKWGKSREGIEPFFRTRLLSSVACLKSKYRPVCTSTT